MAVFGLLRRVVWWKFTEVSEVLIAPMMEQQVSLSVNVYQTTRRYNPRYSHLHTRRRENLKSYSLIVFLLPLACARGEEI
jgi:hypothetical protein